MYVNIWKRKYLKCFFCAHYTQIFGPYIWGGKTKNQYFTKIYFSNRYKNHIERYCISRIISFPCSSVWVPPSPPLCCVEDHTKGLMHARQVLLPLSYIPSPLPVFLEMIFINFLPFRIFFIKIWAIAYSLILIYV